MGGGEGREEEGGRKGGREEEGGRKEREERRGRRERRGEKRESEAGNEREQKERMNPKDAKPPSAGHKVELQLLREEGCWVTCASEKVEPSLREAAILSIRMLSISPALSNT